MRRFLMSVLISGMILGVSSAGSIVEISDSELDSVYAQGFNFTINTDNLRSFNLGGNLYSINVGDINVNDGGLQFNLNSSLMLSGNAQQNAFMPINIVDSAVNIPINIVVIMGDNSGSINISNLLNSYNKSNIGM
ncbi:MAG TPA: hypothetical protein ENK22_02565 [Persephonella sp.]|nr:hypothetical protein [Persephonella sp.]